MNFANRWRDTLNLKNNSSLHKNNQYKSAALELKCLQLKCFRTITTFHL